MKRVIFVFLVLVLVFAMFLGKGPTIASAVTEKTPLSTTPSPTATPAPPLAPANWTVGVETSVDLEKYAPPAWMQLVVNPVKVTTSEEVCHEFRGGQYNWIPEVKQLKNGKWIKVESTAKWTPDTEGKYMVCFEAEAGTYALFAHYSPSVK
ncbi:MAG: hypothetical protein C0410_11710 [Anaerolinea sp.]|nr:hypothetical protein [Anaerolinea sp.]